MQYHVYMIQGANGYFYTGITTDVERRLAQHNGLKKGGARYTRAQRPHTLVYVEVAPSRSDALKRESAIKRMTREEKEVLVKLSKDNLTKYLNVLS